MILTNRKILLFVDNCTAHPSYTFTNIRLEFLPKNTTSKLQPLDQGIIASFKAHYKNIFVRKLVTDLRCGIKPEVNNISILDAINMAKRAWDEVTPETIKNCFIKARFMFISNEENNTTQYIRIETPNLWPQICEQLEIENASFLDYVTCDEELQTCEILTENQVLNNIRNDLLQDECTDISDDDIEEQEKELPKVSFADAIKSIKTLKSYLDSIQCDSDNFEQNLTNLHNMENFLLDNHLENVKQLKITDFFVKM